MDGIHGLSIKTLGEIPGITKNEIEVSFSFY